MVIVGAADEAAPVEADAVEPDADCPDSVVGAVVAEVPDVEDATEVEWAGVSDATTTPSATTPIVAATPMVVVARRTRIRA